MPEAFLSPSGYYVVLRENIGAPGWIVRALNFATWKHITVTFTDEAAARRYFIQWQL